MADQTIRGGCLCGAVRYRASGVPSASMICHCRSCAHAAGAPAVAWITVEAARFVWEGGGTPASFHSTPPVTRTLCPTCGTSLTFAETARPHQIDVTTATLDDPEAFPPTYHSWLHDGPRWLRFGDGLPEYEQARPGD